MKREIEKKYLISDIQAREALVAKLGQLYPDMKHTGNKVIISYFYQKATAQQILEIGKKLLDAERLTDLKRLLKNTGEQVVKCRSVDAEVQFAVKGTKLGDDPVHAADRLELEVVLDKDIESVNQVITDVGVKLVSKWSAKRDFYNLDNQVKAEFEFVSGYGHKAELEIMVEEDQSTEAALKALDELAAKAGLTVATDQLMGRMYKYYCDHWQEYFNTQNTFSNQIWAELKKDLD